MTSDEASAAGPTPASGEPGFGLMRIGEALLALPVSCIREVVPGREAYAALPVGADGLRGAIDLRGTVIPVLDLRLALGLPGEPSVRPAVVVMRRMNRLLGLLVDEVCGVVQTGAAQLFALTAANAGDRPALATHGVRIGTGIAALLDADRIASLPNMPMVDEEQGAARRQAARGEAVLLFGVRGQHFGLPAMSVDATVPRAKLAQGALTSGYCLGTIEHHGVEIPVLDTLAAFGLGPVQNPAETAAVIVRFDEGLLGFTLDEVRQIVQPAQGDVVAMPALPIAGAKFFTGLLADSQGRQHLLLDAAAMRGHSDFSRLTELRKARQAEASIAVGAPLGEAADTARNAQRPAFITFKAGGEQAAPLTDVVEILPYPTHVAPIGDAGCGMVGVFTHRGKAVPLVDLAAWMGRGSAAAASARVLLIQAESQMTGFAVETLNSIEALARDGVSADWRTDPARPPERVVMVGEGEKKRLLPCPNLKGIADELAAGAAAYRMGAPPVTA